MLFVGNESRWRRHGWGSAISHAWAINGPFTHGNLPVIHSQP